MLCVVECHTDTCGELYLRGTPPAWSGLVERSGGRFALWLPCATVEIHLYAHDGSMLIVMMVIDRTGPAPVQGLGLCRDHVRSAGGRPRLHSGPLDPWR